MNVAERLYRVTGAGVYRDSVLVGRPRAGQGAAAERPGVRVGQRAHGPVPGQALLVLGRHQPARLPARQLPHPGATSELPGQGGSTPSSGVDLTYFVDEKTGFARPTAETARQGPHLALRPGRLPRRGRAANGSSPATPRSGRTWRPTSTGSSPSTPRRTPSRRSPRSRSTRALRPSGHTFQRKEGGVDYLYYCTPYPLTRVRARLADLKDVTKYEGFSPLKTGTPRAARQVARRAPARPRPRRPRPLRLAAEHGGPHARPRNRSSSASDSARERILDLRDVETGAFVYAHAGSVSWNAYRNRWVMIAVQSRRLVVVPGRGLVRRGRHPARPLGLRPQGRDPRQVQLLQPAAPPRVRQGRRPRHLLRGDVHDHLLAATTTRPRVTTTTR